MKITYENALYLMCKEGYADPIVRLIQCPECKQIITEVDYPQLEFDNEAKMIECPYCSELI